MITKNKRKKCNIKQKKNYFFLQKFLVDKNRPELLNSTLTVNSLIYAKLN